MELFYKVFLMFFVGNLQKKYVCESMPLHMNKQADRSPLPISTERLLSDKEKMSNLQSLSLVCVSWVVLAVIAWAFYYGFRGNRKSYIARNENKLQSEVNKISKEKELSSVYGKEAGKDNVRKNVTPSIKTQTSTYSDKSSNKSKYSSKSKGSENVNKKSPSKSSKIVIENAVVLHNKQKPKKTNKENNKRSAVKTKVNVPVKNSKGQSPYMDQMSLKPNRDYTTETFETWGGSSNKPQYSQRIIQEDAQMVRQSKGANLGVKKSGVKLETKEAKSGTEQKIIQEDAEMVHQSKGSFLSILPQKQAVISTEVHPNWKLNESGQVQTIIQKDVKLQHQSKGSNQPSTPSKETLVSTEVKPEIKRIESSSKLHVLKDDAKGLNTNLSPSGEVRPQVKQMETTPGGHIAKEDAQMLRQSRGMNQSLLPNRETVASTEVKQEIKKIDSGSMLNMPKVMRPVPTSLGPPMIGSEHKVMKDDNASLKTINEKGLVPLKIDKVDSNDDTISKKGCFCGTTHKGSIHPLISSYKVQGKVRVQSGKGKEMITLSDDTYEVLP